MTIGELLDRVGEVAPWAKAAAWDSIGLQLGDPGTAADRVAVCHEITPTVVDRLLDDPPDLAITYHPLLFHPINRLVAGPGPGGRALRLISAHVAVASVHTNLDAAPGGTADALAEALGLEAVRPFGPEVGPEAVKVVTFAPESHVEVLREAMASAGAGVIGNYTGCSFRIPGTGTFMARPGTKPAVGEPGRLNEEKEWRLEMLAPLSAMSAVLEALAGEHPYEEPAIDVYDVEPRVFLGRVGRLPSKAPLAEVAASVGQRLQAVVRFAGGGEVRDVAVVPGSGAGFADAASIAGADVLVTGDVTHHQAATASERGLSIIDAGHATTERPGVRSLAASVAAIGVPVLDLTALAADPWQWIP